MLTVKKLGSLLQRPPLSVEIIPGDGTEWTSSFTDNEPSIKEHHPFLLVEENLGVPEKLLYKAYMSSIPLLMQSRHCTSTSPTVSSADLSQEDLASSTAIILLANPAHQTAINARKRLVESSVLDPRDELGYITALLAVRSCAKQTIIWTYRRWLLLRVHGSYPSSRSSTGFQKEDSLLGLTMPVESWRHEFNVISRACETYPRNYFAWSHRHLCIEALCALSLEQPDKTKDNLYILTEEFTFVKRWVELHVSDYSAMQYLCILHSTIQSTTKQHPTERYIYADDADTDLVAHACTLIDTYPDHEALWLYLRAAMLTSGLSAGVSGTTSPMIKETEGFARGIQTMSNEGHLEYSETRCTVSNVDSEQIHRHSTRFLQWLEREVRPVKI
ncbi:hypothetical protein CERSUDRAFT_98721 [Gelatoporia subvermispora B]|uniref:Protein prenylyltransferase n=1 Tax=Ceriporiopsis subvermispora (strain B) TaxID=914234 RepID=M2QLT0_CERS8|nr:hypothetical protein CERSUDRAFT_98721 [Gelatoporia subvermispora B]